MQRIFVVLQLSFKDNLQEQVAKAKQSNVRDG